MTCFLEYEPETVVVHDLIHSRSGEGWNLRESSCRKLRISAAISVRQLQALGFEIEADRHGRPGCGRSAPGSPNDGGGREDFAASAVTQLENPG